MEYTDLGKYTKSFGLSLAITSFLSALLVLLKETHEHTVMEWMKTVTFHHWVTHGLINLVVFVLLGVALSRPNNGEGVNISSKALVFCIAGSVVASALLILGFYR
jgi:hypothetical protein